MPRSTKVGVLTAAVESVLMYGSESWTITETLTKRLDGLYTRLLRFALNVSWKDKWTNTRLYKGLPKLSDKLRVRRMIIQGIIALKRLDVKMSKGNVIPFLNGSQLYSSHPKQKCTKIYPEETAPGPRPLPYMGKILTFDKKVVETPLFYQNDRI